MKIHQDKAEIPVILVIWMMFFSRQSEDNGCKTALPNSWLTT